MNAKEKFTNAIKYAKTPSAITHAHALVVLS